MTRFDKVQREREARGAPIPEPAPTANGTANHAPVSPKPPKVEQLSASASPTKRKAADSDDLSDVADSTPPPKKAKKSKFTEETDEQMAKRLAAEFNAPSARSTRGGGSATKKKAPAKKPSNKPKKKSKAKINSDDDSDVDNSSGTPKPEKERKGGFHKPMILSEPLAQLLGEPQLSRPQTVKRIWAYVKERDLQEPTDKRQIRCDDKLRAVFKQDRVHMFTMNKILAGQLYAVDE